MMNYVELERQNARKELARIRFFREWRRTPRLYSIDRVKPDNSFIWEEFGGEKEPVIGFEQICTDGNVIRNKMQHNVFMLSLLFAARDIPEDMTLRIGISPWKYAKFMRLNYWFEEMYLDSLHYMFDQMKDDYVLLIKDERRKDVRSYVKVYPNGEMKRVRLDSEVNVIKEKVPEDLMVDICESSKRLVTEERLQQIEPSGDESDNCIMLKFGLNVWGRKAKDNMCSNERIEGESRYAFVNRFMDLECMKDFRS